MMIQVVSKFHVPMSSRRDMEISLHFVPLQAAKDPACAPATTGGLLELLLPFGFAQDMPDMRITLHLLLEQHGVLLKQMHSAGVDPVAPVRGVFAQHIAREDAVARSVLHVDVEVGAGHGDDDIQINLQVVRYAFFDGEEVRFMSTVPTAELGEGEAGGDYDEKERRVAPRGAAARVGGFGFGYMSDDD